MFPSRPRAYPTRASGSAVCCPPSAQDVAAVRAASDGYYAALNTMFTGDVAPMDAVWSHEPDVTQVGPFGGRYTGWGAVGAEWAHDAGMKLGGKVAGGAAACQHLHQNTPIDSRMPESATSMA
ncbi:MAG: hypothetical protein EXS03_09395 [Phycisphaerales bacterium]|nr:hypothetical protein [Phycisphaerales bacterium]